jgi:hypothetical protein
MPDFPNARSPVSPGPVYLPSPSGNGTKGINRLSSSPIITATYRLAFSCLEVSEFYHQTDCVIHMKYTTGLCFYFDITQIASAINERL